RIGNASSWLLSAVTTSLPTPSGFPNPSRNPGCEPYSTFLISITKPKAGTTSSRRTATIRSSKRPLARVVGDGGHNQPVIKDRWGIRKFTERECARLQGYKDSWLKFPKNLSKQQAYKQVGNSITVPLVAKLAENIMLQL